MLKVGQHVVLVRDTWHPLTLRDVPNLPKKGVVYTVRWIGEAPVPGFDLQLRLVEITNPLVFSGARKHNFEPSFVADRFRPLVKLTTESFTAGLTPVDHLELNLEYQGLKA